MSAASWPFDRHGSRNSRRTPGMGGIGSAVVSGGVEHAEEHGHVLPELGDFGLELTATGSGQAVVLGPVVLVGDAPFRINEPFALQAVERLIERGVLYGQRAVAAVVDPGGDAVAVHGGPGERPENEHVDGTLYESEGSWHAWIYHMVRYSLREVS